MQRQRIEILEVESQKQTAFEALCKMFKPFRVFGFVGTVAFEACEGALVPVTLNHVKDPGEFLIARFLEL